jgi:hypothetical protein
MLDLVAEAGSLSCFDKKYATPDKLWKAGIALINLYCELLFSLWIKI